MTVKSGTLTAARRDVTSDSESDVVSGNRFVEMRLPLNPATIQITLETHPTICSLVEAVLVIKCYETILSGQVTHCKDAS